MGVLALTMKLQNFRLDYEPLSGDRIKTVARTLKDIKQERIGALKRQPTAIKPMVEAMAQGIYYTYHGVFVLLGVIGIQLEHWLHKWAFGK